MTSGTAAKKFIFVGILQNRDLSEATELEMITYRQLTRGDVESAKYLYDALGWTAYLGDDERLYRAWDNSLFALGAFDDDKLIIGFIRCIGDGEHTILIQDLLILENYQRKGIGKTLMEVVFDKYADVRQKFVVTGVDTPAVHFYRSLGLYSFDEGDLLAFFKL